MDNLNWPKASKHDLNLLEVIRELFRWDPLRVEKLFRCDRPEMLGNFDEMLKLIAPWSSGEQELAKVALMIWFDKTPDIDLYYLINGLDKLAYDSLISALNKWRAS